MKLWLDDERPMPVDYDVHVKTAKDCIEILLCCEVSHLSLDHDLGDYEKCGNGYDVAKWIEEQCYSDMGVLVPMHVNLHSANPVGVKNMRAAIVSAKDLAPHLILSITIEEAKTPPLVFDE